MKEETRLKLMFIIPSTIGVLLFMVPILVHDTWTVLVKLLADHHKSPDRLPDRTSSVLK
jgi:nucleoside recognition membrane protein YjiH